MDMYPDLLRKQIDELNNNLNALNNQLKDSSKSSDKLQRNFIFWTIVMTVAVAIQTILIAIQIFR